MTEETDKKAKEIPPLTPEQALGILRSMKGDIIDRAIEIRVEAIEEDISRGRLDENEVKEIITAQFRPLVKSIARSFYWAVRKGYCEYDDILHEGFKGLTEAINRFDPTVKDTQFITYATKTIEGIIKTFARDKTRMIRRAAWIQNKLPALYSAEQELLSAGLEVTDEALVKKSGIPLKDITALRSGETLSLDLRLGREGEGKPISSRIADTRYPLVEKQVHSSMENTALMAAIQLLPDDERRVMEAYYEQLQDKETHPNFKEIGRFTTIHFDRVHRLFDRACNTLRGVLEPKETPPLAAHEEGSSLTTNRSDSVEFSEWELDALSLIVQGKEYKNIAAETEVGFSKVKTQVKSLFQKLGVNSRKEAVSKAIELGIIEAPTEKGIRISAPHIEVLCLLAIGKDPEAIAEAIGNGVTVPAVNGRIATLRRALDVNRTNDVVPKARALGLIDEKGTWLEHVSSPSNSSSLGTSPRK